jgi:DNA (cytosine-5)-methyltransferase 1
VTPSVLSLFSGAGGLDLGFARAGFTVVWANDIDAYACETYRRNLGPHVHHGDVRAVDVSRLPLGDVVIGGPPCQGLSVGGEQRPGDPRNDLLWEFVRVVGATQPRGFAMENVPSLAGLTRASLARWGPLRDRLLRALAGLGYAVRVFLLDASNFGTAQRRRRAFFVGTAHGLPPVLGVPPPPGVAGRLVTAGEALRSLPPPGPGNEGPCPARITLARNPQKRRSAYAGMLLNGAGRPIDLSRPAPTVCASSGGNKTLVIDESELRHGAAPWAPGYHAHLEAGGEPLAEAPARLRRLTLTEAALLQGFPAGYVFAGPPASRWRQIGNAVPPPLAEAVARALLGALGGGTKVTGG